MKYLLTILPIAATVVASTLEVPAEDPVLGTDTVHGCYSSLGELKLNGTNEFNSQGYCGSTCRDLGAYVAATKGSSCYCGNTYPPASTLVDDSTCNEPCPGYASNACGGLKAYTIINTGVKVDVSDSSAQGSTTSSSTSAASATTISGTTTTAAPTGIASNGTSSTGSSTSTSASTTATVSTNGAASLLSLSGLGMAILGMGAVFLF